jgi:hypothetical protein
MDDDAAVVVVVDKLDVAAVVAFLAFFLRAAAALDAFVAPTDAAAEGFGSVVATPILYQNASGGEC